MRVFCASSGWRAFGRKATGYDRDRAGWPNSGIPADVAQRRAGFLSRDSRSRSRGEVTRCLCFGHWKTELLDARVGLETGFRALHAAGDCLNGDRQDALEFCDTAAINVGGSPCRHPSRGVQHRRGFAFPAAAVGFLHDGKYRREERGGVLDRAIHQAREHRHACQRSGNHAHKPNARMGRNRRVRAASGRHQSHRGLSDGYGAG